MCYGSAEHARSSGADVRIQANQTPMRFRAPDFPSEMFSGYGEEPGLNASVQTSLRTIPFTASDAGPAVLAPGVQIKITAHPHWRSDFFLPVLTPPNRFASTAVLKYGARIQATERAQRSFFDVERGHRKPKSCEERIECHSGQGRFWRGQRPSPHNQSKSPLNPCS